MVRPINKKSEVTVVEEDAAGPVTDKIGKTPKEYEAAKVRTETKSFLTAEEEALRQKGGKKPEAKKKSSKEGGKLTSKQDIEKAKKVVKRGIVYKEVSAQVYDNSKGTGLTVEDAKDYLGWEECADEETDFLFKDANGKKIRLNNNSTNRPFRLGFAKRYMNEMLRNKWALNGETIVIDRQGMVQSGQHRLPAFIMAEQTRLKEENTWNKYGWSGPITLDAIVVTGISEDREVVNTLDLGQKRSLGDVLFRDGIFSKLDNPTKKRLSNTLSGAARLVWIRQGGQTVSDARHFPHSEALDFIEEHPKLVECVQNIFELDKGKDTKIGNRISQYISIGYASGLMYMMMVSGTDPEVYHEYGPERLDYSMEDKAFDFWEHFALSDLTAGHPIFILRKLLPKITASSGMNRDEIVGTVIKAFNLWADGKVKVTESQVMMEKQDNELGRPVLTEEPRLGGIDVSVTPADKPDNEGAVAEAMARRKDTRIGKQSKKGKYQEGDTFWVTDPDGDHWFGTVVAFHKGEKGVKDYVIAKADNGKEWEADVDVLSIEKPE